MRQRRCRLYLSLGLRSRKIMINKKSTPLPSVVSAVVYRFNYPPKKKEIPWAGASLDVILLMFIHQHRISCKPQLITFCCAFQMT